MTFENITQLINQLLPFRTVPEVEAYRRANTTDITAFLNKHFDGVINRKAIVKLFEENGYPIDRIVASNMSDDARAERTKNRIQAYERKRRAAH